MNVWGQCASNEQEGVIYCPTGSASYDFYGGDRKGANLYANSVVALEGKSGKLRWHRQLVHHDIWDYDLPAKPVPQTVALRLGGHGTTPSAYSSFEGTSTGRARRTKRACAPVGR